MAVEERPYLKSGSCWHCHATGIPVVALSGWSGGGVDGEDWLCQPCLMMAIKDGASPRVKAKGVTTSERMCLICHGQLGVVCADCYINSHPGTIVMHEGPAKPSASVNEDGDIELDGMSIVFGEGVV